MPDLPARWRPLKADCKKQVLKQEAQEAMVPILQSWQWFRCGSAGKKWSDSRHILKVEVTNVGHERGMGRRIIPKVLIWTAGRMEFLSSDVGETVGSNQMKDWLFGLNKTPGGWHHERSLTWAIGKQSRHILKWKSCKRNLVWETVIWYKIKYSYNPIDC